MSAQWAGLPAFLTQFALGLCRTLPICKPAWYSYNGVIFPALPNGAYPYAVIYGSELYLFSGPPAVVVNEDGSYSFLAWETDLNVAVMYVSGNAWKKKSSFTVALDTSFLVRGYQFVWSNFDMYTMDAQLLLSASEPLPATDYLTTLFEGDVTTVAEEYIYTDPNGKEYPQTFPGAHAVIADGSFLDGVNLIRVTVDGAPVGYQVRPLMFGSYAGNYYLIDAEKEDTGGDFCVSPMLTETLFFSREPGTYHVKVEKIERRAQKEPVAYLYNGVRLPKLPEWDMAIYGKAFLEIESLNYIAPGAWSAHVYFCADAKTDLYETILSSTDYLFATSYIRWTLYDDLSAAFYECEPNQWINETVVDQSDFTRLKPLSVVKWANFDIYNSDGTLYLAASDPIPVYE